MSEINTQDLANAAWALRSQMFTQHMHLVLYLLDAAKLLNGTGQSLASFSSEY